MVEGRAVGGAFGRVDCRAVMDGRLVVWLGFAGAVRTAQVVATKYDFAAPADGQTAGACAARGFPCCIAAVGAIGCSGESGRDGARRGRWGWARGEREWKIQKVPANGVPPRRAAREQGAPAHAAHPWDAGGKQCTRSSEGRCACGVRMSAGHCMWEGAHG